MEIFNANHKTNKKAKYAGTNLNNCPTINDLRFGKIAAGLAVDHQISIVAKTFDGMVLSEKIARALKEFRATLKKEKLDKRNSLRTPIWKA